MAFRDQRGWVKQGAVALLLAGSVGLAPAVAEATVTRVYTLGAMNRFILDDTNRWLYPHIITKFGNLFYVDLFGSAPSQNTSAPDSQRQSASAIPGDLAILDAADSVPVQQTAGGGVILALTDDLFISAHLSDYENPVVPQFLGLFAASAAGDPSAYPWLPIAPDSPESANRKFDLFLAYNLQDLAQFGLQFSYGSSKYRRSPNDNDPDVMADLQGGVESRKDDAIGVSELGFLLGAGIDLGELAAIDIGLGMTFHSLTYEPNLRSNLIEGGGGLELQADIRAMIGLTEWWELVPAISFRFARLAAADLGDFGNGLVYNDDIGRERYFITDVSASRTVLDIGVAGHFKPAEAIHFWGAVGFHVMSVQAQYENTIADAPDAGLVRDQNLEFSRDSYAVDATPYFRLALEAKIFSWLDFRGGIVKYVRADSVKEDKVDDNNADGNRLNTVTRDYPFFDYFVGFAAHYAGFFLDFQVDPFWFQRGPELLSGASGSGGGNMFVNASLGYRF